MWNTVIEVVLNWWYILHQVLDVMEFCLCDPMTRWIQHWQILNRLLLLSPFTLFLKVDFLEFIITNGILIKSLASINLQTQ